EGWRRHSHPGAWQGGGGWHRVLSQMQDASALCKEKKKRGGQKLVAEECGIGSLEDYYHFHHSKTFKRSTLSSRGPHNFLRMDPKVEWLQQQEVKRRVKRQVRGEPHALPFNDPVWPNMWYLHCGDKSSRCRSEMNILAAWQRGYTGKNVVVTILDDGIERNHPDLLQNYDPLASYDVNGNDHDPTPRYDASNENKHGTRCAGEVAAAANNSYCIVGIAYNARIGGIRMLDGDVTDVVEAKSLGIRPDYIDIYSASWGPDDDGKTVDGPGLLAKQAFEHGIKKGRRGLGSIFVWASGNGGREGDYCSCDGYTNSIYTISISSTTENGYKPWYLEECASTLATTYSSGAFYERKIVTTDLRHRCTDGHTGTSVSAPMVAGIIALALEANPLLTWRDVQHLLVKTSRPVHLRAPDWKTNGAGHKVSHLYGFGLVDADAIVVEAKKWKAVPPQHVCVGSLDRVPKYIRADHVLRASTLSSACADHRDQHVLYLEHVVVRLSISHPRRGDLQISLVSPAGTRSQLLARRVFDHSNEGFKGWEFMTVHCWGERAAGEWTLEIHDTPSQVRNPGVLRASWQWGLGGCSASPLAELVSPSPGPCHPECGDQGCDGPNADQCLNCIHYSLGSVKTGRMCVSSCPAGFFGDKGARRCRRCYKGCERCVGRGANQCTACKRSLYHHQEMNTCVVLCPPGFYAEERKDVLPLGGCSVRIRGGRFCFKRRGTYLSSPRGAGAGVQRGSAAPTAACKSQSGFYSPCLVLLFWFFLKGQKRCLKCHQSCKKCVGEADKCTASLVSVV
uniref:Proprotein convertase subtilisin/kexin type 6 n=1 Tax=Calidris pygmaea TaxID=425635 RepID=A0A8C3KD53_9CHAR